MATPRVRTSAADDKARVRAAPKLAVTVSLLPETVWVQTLPDALSHPDQLTKAEPPDGVAVKVRTVASATISVHVPLVAPAVLVQLMVLGEVPAMVPVPAPAPFIESVRGVEHVAVQPTLRPVVLPVFVIAMVTECEPALVAVNVSARVAGVAPIVKIEFENVPVPPLVSDMSAVWVPLLVKLNAMIFPIERLVTLIVSVLSPTPFVPMTVPLVEVPTVPQFNDCAIAIGAEHTCSSVTNNAAQTDKTNRLIAVRGRCTNLEGSTVSLIVRRLHTIVIIARRPLVKPDQRTCQFRSSNRMQTSHDRLT